MPLRTTGLIAIICFSTWSLATAAPTIPAQPQSGRLNIPAHTQTKGQLQRVVDSLIGLSIQLRPQEQVLKSVAGVKGYSTPPTPAATAFRCGSQMVVLQIAEQTGKQTFVNATKATIMKELENLTPEVTPITNSTDNATLRQRVEHAVEQRQVRTQYELGIWVEAVRIPLRHALRQPGAKIPAPLLLALTKDSQAVFFQQQLPHTPVHRLLTTLAQYQNAPGLTAKELFIIADQLDAISEYYR